MTVADISVQNKGFAVLLDGGTSCRLTPAVRKKYKSREVRQIILNGGMLYVELEKEFEANKEKMEDLEKWV